MPEETQPTQKPARDPQALTSEYHKARKQLMLWAGILFIWELVGIDLEKAKEAGGNAGAIITAIKSPQAVPWVLLILVAYFLFKTSIEWYQCSGPRRALRVSRIDFGSAWIVTVLACALYAYQAISRIQFADVVQRSNMSQSLLTAFPAGFIIMTFTKGILGRKAFLNTHKIVGGVYVTLVFIGLIWVIARGYISLRYGALGFGLGAGISFLLLYLTGRKSAMSKA